MNNNKITVIVPVYNCKKYINRCIKSITNQSHSNMELILINDGSTDGSGTLCDKWAKKDNRIKVIHQKNQGCSKARNVGIDSSTGDYLMFVDSDDYIEKDMLSDTLSILKKHDADIVVADYDRVDTDIDFSRIQRPKGVREYSGYSSFENMVVNDGLEEQRTVVLWGKLYKKDIFKDIRLPVGVYGEDIYIIPQELDIAKKIVYYDKVLYHYAYVDNGLSSFKPDKEVIILQTRKDIADKMYKKINSDIFSRYITLYLNMCIDNYKKNIELNNNDELNTIYDLYTSTFKKYKKDITMNKKSNVKNRLFILNSKLYINIANKLNIWPYL